LDLNGLFGGHGILDSSAVRTDRSAGGFDEITKDMKKSPRNRSRSGSARAAAAGARDLDPRADGDPQLSAALQSFESLTVGNKLQFLAVILRDEIDRKVGERVPTIEPAPDPAAPEFALPMPPADPAPVLAAPKDAVSEPAPTAAGPANVQIVESDAWVQDAPRNYPFPVTISEVRGPRTADARPASFPTVPILMTMVCSFVLTLAVLLWHRQSDASASQSLPPSSLERPLESAMPPAMSPAPMPAARRAITPVQRLASPPLASPPPLAPGNAARDDREPANDLPVELSFRRRPVRNEEEHGGRFAWQLTGRIHNLSSEALAVDVSVDGDAGPTYAQVMIDPEGDADFGSNDGLEIHPNDRITLHSAPYSDVVSQVR
jgi:hypothetical protein